MEACEPHPSSEGQRSKAPPRVSSGLGCPLLNTHPTAPRITGFYALLCSLMNLTPVLWGHHPTFSTSAVSLQGVKLPAAFPTLHGVCGRHPVRYTQTHIPRQLTQRPLLCLKRHAGLRSLYMASNIDTGIFAPGFFQIYLDFSSSSLFRVSTSSWI